MLAARRHAGRLQRAHDHAAQSRHVLGPIGQRAIANHRVLRIGVDVENGRVVEVDADGAQLGRERGGEARGQRLVAASSQRRHRRPFGERPLQARDAPALLIDADPERPVRGEPRHFTRQLGDLARLDECCGRSR